jgi:Flavin containing amine oxidoreductase
VNATDDSTTSARLDYAIVGGGVSGLYTAWRLLGSGVPASSIAIYEMGERTGGRLLTWLPAGASGGLRAELGGMRFFSQQELVWNLLPQLGFGANDILDFPVTGPNLRLLLRGVSMPLDTTDPTARYKLPSSEQGKSPGTLLEDVIQQVLATPENKAVIQKYLGGKPPQDRQDWDKIKPYLTWRGRGLWDVGFWNLLSDVRSPETYQYLTDAFGYYSLAANWNAAEAMQSVQLDFTQNPQYKTLREGYSALPDMLASKVTQAGCKPQLETRLVRFDRQGDGSWALFLAGPQGNFAVQAGRVFLGLPRHSLELLAPSPAFDLQGNPGLKRLVQSVTPFPAFKLFLFYGTRWWETYGIQKGRSICDLPIRQTYYFAPDPGLSVTPSYGLLMASYDDARAVDYWQGLVPPEDEWEQGRAELREALVGLTRQTGLADAAEDVVPDPPPHLHKATDGMLRHAKTQLALLHDIPESKIPDPVVGAFADWGFDPFGGGWNFWGPQVDVRSAMQSIKAPLGQGLYVVGEAYSGVQGWVEGALTTTEIVLEKYLNLPRPSWLPASYYLGW